MRYSFVKTLIKEAKKNKNLILLTGDLGFTVFEEFRELFPKQFINVGVAEQNMMGIAAGLASVGKTVFAYSIATFATLRGYEQIRNDIAFHNLPVTVVGSGAGLSYGHAGMTHHALEDIAVMRTMPNMRILCPADPLEVEWATSLSAAAKFPIYLRIGKKGESLLFKKSTKFKIGKGIILRNGEKIFIIATGNIVKHALSSAEILKSKKLNPAVMSLASLKPIDKKSLIDKIKDFSHVVTIEEHFLTGGLGSAIAEIIAEMKNAPLLQRIAVPDVPVQISGSQEYLRDQFGLSPEKIAYAILNRQTYD